MSDQGADGEVDAEGVSRRTFLEKALIGAGIVSATSIVASASIAMSPAIENAPPVDHAAVGHTSGDTGATNGAAPATMDTPEEIDRHHKEVVDQFLQNQKSPLTKGKGNQPLTPTIENGVKVFNITCEEVEWEVTPGKVVQGRGYSGTIPGPIIRATEGDRVRIVVKNNLTESTSVHWHGLYVPNNMDGVAFVTQPQIKPGETFTYEFTLRNPGTHMYHSHHNAMDQVNRGLLGAFIVDPKDPSGYPRYDREYIMVLNDLSHGFTINGKGFPATDALVAKKGERVLIRYLNEGVMNHPMHLHGMPMQVFQKDGWPINPPQMCDTIDVAPGNRYDVLVEATEEGLWAFHCHVLTHAESAQGMFGLVTVMVVEA
jgi:FtsP/CotA-like multicopper oxidase with cupredoxin domain